MFIVQVSNGGPTAVATSIVKIDWPSADNRGLKLLYISEPIQVSRQDVACKLFNETVSFHSTL